MTETAETGSSVGIRPYARTDSGAVRAMRLSPRSLHQRFFSGNPRVPAHYTRMLERVDHDTVEALVALAGDEIIGVAEYVRDANDPVQADLAVMIADAWQRRGVGRALVTALADLAFLRGVHELRADVLAGNTGANAAVHSGWPGVPGRRADGGTVAYLLPLPSAWARSGTTD